MTLFWLCMGFLIGCLWTALAWHLGWRKGFTEADKIRSAAVLEQRLIDESTTDEYQLDRSDA